MPKRGKHHNHCSGSRHPRWNGAGLVDSQGYALVRVGKTHPLADANGYCREHVLVALGAGLLPLGESNTLVVHHRNGDRLDNRIENLEVMQDREHRRLHRATRNIGPDGRLLPKAGRILDGRTWDELPGRSKP